MASTPGPKDAGATSAPPAVSTVEDEFPDPDEDDLDDLDDMLDDFSFSKLKAPDTAKAAQTAGSGPSASQHLGASQPAAAAPQGPSPNDVDGEELARQLQEGVDGMIHALKQNPEMQGSFEDMLKTMWAAYAEGPEQLRKVFSQKMKEEEAMLAAHPGAAEQLQQLRDQSLEEVRAAKRQPSAAADKQRSAAPKTTAASPPAKPAAGPSPAAPSADPARADLRFQETIRRTMERMETSGEQATAAAATESGGGDDDLMSEILRTLSQGGMGGEGSEEDLSKMLLGIMEQISSKEVLYDPMKELHGKYPGWLAQHRAATPPEDLARYEQQLVLVREVVAKFELPSYSDANAQDREYIWERMQQMQALGSPPSDLVGDLATAQDAIAAADDQCNTQ